MLSNYQLSVAFAQCLNIDLSVGIDVEDEEREAPVKKKSDGPGKQRVNKVSL